MSVILPSGTFIDDSGVGVAFNDTNGIICVADGDDNGPGAAALLTEEAARALGAKLTRWAEVQRLQGLLAKHRDVLKREPDHTHAQLMVTALEIELSAHGVKS